MEKQDYKYMVCTRCMTYNHAPYIEDALRGFAMQETTFPVVFTIIDDASTDGEPDVLRKWVDENLDFEEGTGAWKDMPYGQITVANLKGKPLSTFVILLLNENHYGRKSKIPYIAEWNENAKYIAICEGDDYWTEPKKLQEQIEILNADTNIKMVYSAFKTVNSEGETIEVEKYRNYIRFSRSGDEFSRLLWRNFILTLTVCFRKEVEESDIYKGAPSRLDYLYFLSAASTGDICFLNHETGCYRITSTGAVATRSSQIYTKLNKLCDYFSLIYVKGSTKRIEKRYGRFVMSLVILTRAFRNKENLREILRAKKTWYLLIPLALLIKAIDYVGLRCFRGYSEFTFYNILSCD